MHRCWRAWLARMLLAVQDRRLPGAWQQLQPQPGRPPEALRAHKQVPLRLRVPSILCRRQPHGSASASCCARPSLHSLEIHSSSVQLLLGGCLLPVKGCSPVGDSQAATYAHWPAGRSAQGASTEHAAALAALPADSAMKALVEHFAGSSSATGNCPPSFRPTHQQSIHMLMFLGYSVAAPEHGPAHSDRRPAGRGRFWHGSELQDIGAQVLGSCRAASPLGLGPDLRPLPEVSTRLRPPEYCHCHLRRCLAILLIMTALTGG